jgi:hypothetical protein
MFIRSEPRQLPLIIASILLVCSSAAFAIQEKATKPLPEGVPVLWQEPRDIASRDLYLGPGGESMKPDTSKVTIVEEKASGRSIKYRVRDGSGREWQIKIGDDTRAETASSRLVWAVGYYTDVTYLVPSVDIEGKGNFRNVRFEARTKGIKRLTEWEWDSNPFSGSQELEGLKVMLALLDNWNIKNENTKILFVRDDEAGRNELRYVISDFDMRTDRTAASPSFWYQTRATTGAALIAGVRDGVVDFNYAGKHMGRLSGISVAHARWAGGWLSRLSDRQIRDALRAANFNAEESSAIEKTLKSRIKELAALK